jgi:hypothetical protein
MPAEPEALSAPQSAEPDWLALVRARVRGLRYGAVQLVVHDGRVTQIECTEKVRLAGDRADPVPR